MQKCALRSQLIVDAVEIKLGAATSGQYPHSTVDATIAKIGYTVIIKTQRHVYLSDMRGPDTAAGNGRAFSGLCRDARV
jgi:hypothetical protein